MNLACWRSIAQPTTPSAQCWAPTCRRSYSSCRIVEAVYRCQEERTEGSQGTCRVLVVPEPESDAVVELAQVKNLEGSSSDIARRNYQEHS
jgi:hypothetical protein